MTEQASPLDDPGRDAPDAGDDRIAQVLRGETSSQSLRHELMSEQSPQSEDLLARLDALDFVNQVVGVTGDMPQRIAEYRIKGLLGRGGMGTVYLGYQEELEREVALKVLSPALSADPTMRKRFRAEARATAALHHRHIVPIYDYGEAQGMLFFTMERVDGMSLDKHIAAARRLRRKPMEPIEAAHRFAGVADALGLAHRRRLLHRDVKPGNILVAADGTLALTDFGLAKALDQASARLTSKGGGFLGTLHYSSPEQALGIELTPASDLYAFGVTMFEAVAGELPFAAKTTEALLQAILHGTPRRLRELVPKAPRDLDAVIEKLLNREPADRYQDGEALARDLLRIRDGEPVHIRRLPLHVRLYRRARKNPGLASAIAAACLLLLLTVALSAGLWREKGQSLASRHQNHLAQIATDIGNESGPPTGPGPLLQALTGLEYTGVTPSQGVLRSFDQAHKELPDDPQVPAMRSAYLDDPLPAASGMLREGRGYEALQLYDRAIADAILQRSSGSKELAAELRLYGLYLGAGAANLTAAVARVSEARTDLVLAAYLRPGAAFPRALLDILDIIEVAQGADAATAAQRLEQQLAAAAAERVRVIGQLLIAVAGMRPLGPGNLMSFRLAHGERLELHRLGERLLSRSPAPLEPAVATPSLATRLAGLAQQAIDQLADPAALRVTVEIARVEVERCVHPEAPLSGWIGALQLIERPLQRAPLVDASGAPLSPMLQLAAWEAMLRLGPKREALALWLTRFDELHRLHPNLPGMLEVAACLHLHAGSPSAGEFVAAWVEAAGGDPEAQLCRMQLRLRAGDLDGALDDAMVAVQESGDRAAVAARVAAFCDQAAAEVDPSLRPRIAEIAATFRDFSPAASATEGGR